MDRILLYGGGFDPIHNGHLRLALHASEALCADVFFIPNRIPPWKIAFASSEDRAAMIELAIEETGNPHLHLSRYELDLDSDTNFTIDTVRHFKQAYPETEICFLIGGDQANVFDKWKDPDELSKLVRIIVTPRPGVEINPTMAKRYGMETLHYDKTGDVSSSSIRDMSHGDIPEAVRAYIESHRLYYMKALEKYYSKKRLTHVLSVGNLAYRIAKHNGLEKPYRFYLAGILHDIAKKRDKEESEAIMSLFFPKYRSMPKWTYHQFVGAYLAKEELRIADQGILDAIACHATGKANMSPMDMIIYSSDKIEPTRGYDSSGYIQACMEDYENGFRVVLEANREFYHEEGYSFEDNEMTAACVQQYLGEKQ